MAQCPRKLAADRVDIGRQHIEQNQPQIPGEKCDLTQQRGRQKQQAEAGQGGQHPDGEHPVFIAAPLQPIPDDRIGDPHRGDRYDQVARLEEQIRHAVFRAGENPGVERRQQKGQKSCPEGTDSEQHRVGHQIPIGIHGTLSSLSPKCRTGPQQGSAESRWAMRQSPWINDLRGSVQYG